MARLVQFLRSKDIQCYAAIRVPCFLVSGGGRSPHCKRLALVTMPVRVSSMVPLSSLVSCAEQVCGGSPYLPPGSGICVKVTFLFKLIGFTSVRTESIFLSWVVIWGNALEKFFLALCSSNGQKSHRLAKPFVKHGLLREMSLVSVICINHQGFSWNKETFHTCNLYLVHRSATEVTYLGVYTKHTFGIDLVMQKTQTAATSVKDKSSTTSQLSNITFVLFLKSSRKTTAQYN